MEIQRAHKKVQTTRYSQEGRLDQKTCAAQL